MIDWVIGQLTDWSLDWFKCAWKYSTDWLIDWPWLIDCSNDWLIAWLTDWLVTWLIDCLIGSNGIWWYPTDWLIDWSWLILDQSIFTSLRLMWRWRFCAPYCSLIHIVGYALTYFWAGRVDPGLCLRLELCVKTTVFFVGSVLFESKQLCNNF